MTTRERLRAAVAETAKRPVRDIQDDTRLAEDLGLRSLQRVELAVLLEEKLGMPVSDDKVMSARTIADLQTALGL
jgi:acyl carrier protein